MNKVFIIQDNSRLDFKKARKFGEIVPVIGQDVFPDNADTRVKKMKGVAKGILSRFNASTDYVLLTGDPVAIAVVTSVLFMRSQYATFLKWDKESKAYYPVRINFYDDDDPRYRK